MAYFMKIVFAQVVTWMYLICDDFILWWDVRCILILIREKLPQNTCQLNLCNLFSASKNIQLKFTKLPRFKEAYIIFAYIWLLHLTFLIALLYCQHWTLSVHASVCHGACVCVPWPMVRVSVCVCFSTVNSLMPVIHTKTCHTGTNIKWQHTHSHTETDTHTHTVTHTTTTDNSQKNLFVAFVNYM